MAACMMRNALPLADAAHIGDTILFYNCELDGSTQIQIVGLNDWIILSGSNGLPCGGNGGGYGAYNCSLFVDDTLSSVKVKRPGIKLFPRDTSYILQNERVFQGFAPGNYAYTQNPVILSGITVFMYDSTGEFGAPP